MKKLFILLSIFTVVGINAQTATYTWTNADNDFNYENPNNWTPDPTVITFGVNNYPTNGDNVQLDPTISNDNLIINSDYGVNSIVLKPGYTGVVDCSGSDFISLSALSILSGTFKCPYIQLEVTGNLNKGASGTFVKDPAGYVQMNITNTSQRTITGSFDFSELRILGTGSFQSRIINFGTGTSTCQALSLIGGSYPFAYRGSINVTGTLSVSGSTAAAASSNTGTIIFTGSGAKTIVGTSSPLFNPIKNITFNTSGSVSMSGDLCITGTWSVANIGSFTQGTSLVTMSGGTVSSGTTTTKQAYFDNLSTVTGSTTVFSGTSFVSLTGNLVNNGSITPNSSLLRLSGSGAQAISGSSLSINAIEVNNTGTKTLSTPVNVLDSVKISAAGTLASGGNLRLKSTLSLKARIAEIASGGSISGNVTVETFAKGGSAGWAELGGSGITGLTFNSWYGQIPMTIEGSATGVTSAGGYYFESVQGWNENNSYGYDTTIVVTSPINVGKGYWVYLASSTSAANDMVWTVSGTPVSGSVPIPLTFNASPGGQAGSNLIANPYASPISWTKLRNGNTNVDNAVYTYNADGGVYASYVNGVGTNGGSDVIPMGQGFYVTATVSTVLTAQESNKVSFNTSSNQLLRPSASNNTSSSNIGQVIKLKLNGTNGDFDETAFRFHNVTTPAYDNEWDAKKIFATPGYAGYPGVYSYYTTISSKSGNQDYSINSLPSLATQSVSIPVLVKVMSTGSYTIAPVDLQNLSNPSCAVLHDKLLNVYHPLSNGPYICNISDTTSAPRFELNICSQSVPTSVSNVTAIQNNLMIGQDQKGAFVTTSFDTPTKAVISVYNIVGQQLIDNITVNGTETSTYLPLNLHNQVVLVRVTTDKQSLVKKIVLH